MKAKVNNGVNKNENKKKKKEGNDNNIVWFIQGKMNE